METCSKYAWRVKAHFLETGLTTLTCPPGSQRCKQSRMLSKGYFSRNACAFALLHAHTRNQCQIAIYGRDVE
eukprot:5848406-Pyramimonas_sp.AAC.1